MEVFFFAVLIPILFLIAVAYINRCKSCGTMTYSFRKARCGDIDRGEAYLVCSKCGYKVCAGSVDETGTVLWNTGHTGVFLDDGEYKSTGTLTAMVFILGNVLGILTAQVAVASSQL